MIVASDGHLKIKFLVYQDAEFCPCLLVDTAGIGRRSAVHLGEDQDTAPHRRHRLSREGKWKVPCRCCPRTPYARLIVVYST